MPHPLIWSECVALSKIGSGEPEELGLTKIGV
jgi:hypothetical protein